MTTLRMELNESSYDITVGKNLLNSADKYFNLDRKVLIVTDDGVPKQYSETIAKLAKEAHIVTVKSGEESKSFDTLKTLLGAMCNAEFGRGDCAIAVGGGVVGDLTGFAASMYMRGIDFYNVPTTLLSQVDSSIGGKTAINFNGIKNVVGAFNQPKAVLIDTDTLLTLDERQKKSGLCEAIKMAMTSDKDLFELIEKLSKNEIYDHIDEIIVKSLKIKKAVVEEDEKETGLRKILNFGHTLGHGIESEEGMSGLLHGECVALGMPPMCSSEAESRLVAVLKKVGLDHVYHGNIKSALGYVSHDKKCSGKSVSVITVKEIGKCSIDKMSIDVFCNTVLNYYK